MPVILYARDEPNRALRVQHRVAHLGLRRHLPRSVSLWRADYERRRQVVGSLMVLDLPDRAALDAHMGFVATCREVFYSGQARDA